MLHSCNRCLPHCKDGWVAMLAHLWSKGSIVGKGTKPFIDIMLCNGWGTFFQLRAILPPSGLPSGGHIPMVSGSEAKVDRALSLNLTLCSRHNLMLLSNIIHMARQARVAIIVPARQKRLRETSERCGLRKVPRSR